MRVVRFALGLVFDSQSILQSLTLRRFVVLHCGIVLSTSKCWGSTETAPDDAVTVAAPLPTAVTSPDVLTVTTWESLDDHSTDAPSTGWPLASRTVAENRTVSPSATKSTAAGVTATDAGRGGGGGTVGAVEGMSQEANAMIRNSGSGLLARRTQRSRGIRGLNRVPSLRTNSSPVSHPPSFRSKVGMALSLFISRLSLVGSVTKGVQVHVLYRTPHPVFER